MGMQSEIVYGLLCVELEKALLEAIRISKFHPPVLVYAKEFIYPIYYDCISESYGEIKNQLIIGNYMNG